MVAERMAGKGHESTGRSGKKRPYVIDGLGVREAWGQNPKGPCCLVRARGLIGEVQHDDVFVAPRSSLESGILAGVVADVDQRDVET